MTAPEPTRDRAELPEGYTAPEGDGDLLGWPVVYERLSQAKNYWISTATRDGLPHAAPIWGAWVDGKFYFEGSPATRWGRNVVSNPRVEIHLESGNEVVIVGGTVEDQDDVGAALAERVYDAFAAKYDGYRTQQMGFFILTPRKVVAWTHFPQDITRFRFE